MKKLDHKQIAYIFLRMAMGINMLGHGIARLPKINGFSEWMVETFEPTMLPNDIVYGYATALPFIEFFLGIFLILGIFSRKTIIVTGLLILSLIFGSTLLEKWDWVSTQMLYALFVYFLLAKLQYNRCCITK